MHTKILFSGLLLSMFFVGGCMNQARSESDGIQKKHHALLAAHGDECLDEIQAAMQEMLRIDNIKFSPDIFKTSSTLTLSNIRTNEHNPQKEGGFDSDIYTARFLLHKESQTCLISLVDSSGKALKTRSLSKCQCK